MIITIENGSGLTGIIENWTLQVSVGGSVLYNGNSPYSGIGIVSGVGDGCLWIGGSSTTVKYITFGPITYVGDIYVRIGTGTGESNQSFQEYRLHTFKKIILIFYLFF